MVIKYMTITVLLLASPFAAKIALADTAQPMDTVQAFYGTVLDNTTGGLPSDNILAQLDTIITPELIAVLKSAATTQAACIKAALPDEKPLLIEGDVFTGNYEGAVEVAYGELAVTDSSAHLVNTLLYTDSHFAKAHKFRAVTWQDTLELSLVDGRWLVADIVLSGKRSLLADLEAYIAEGKTECAAP